jgi:hypothetical protein
MTHDWMWFEDYVIIPVCIAIAGVAFGLLITVGAQDCGKAQGEQRAEDLRTAVCDVTGHDGGACALVCE